MPALLLAVALSQQVNLLSLGEDVARSLGARVGWVRLVATGVAVLLAGAAVSVAGPIGFLGLIAPHLARWLVGSDYRRVIPLSALLGASLLLLADVAARLVDRPLETPVGILVVALGGTFLRVPGPADELGLAQVSPIESPRSLHQTDWAYV